MAAILNFVWKEGFDTNLKTPSNFLFCSLFWTFSYRWHILTIEIPREFIYEHKHPHYKRDSTSLHFLPPDKILLHVHWSKIFKKLSWTQPDNICHWGPCWKKNKLEMCVRYEAKTNAPSTKYFNWQSLKITKSLWPKTCLYLLRHI